MFYLETIPQDQQCNDNYFQRSYGSFAFFAMAIPAILLSGDADIVRAVDFMVYFSYLQCCNKEKTRCEIMTAVVNACGRWYITDEMVDFRHGGSEYEKVSVLERP